MPPATLTPLPPKEFQGTVVQFGSTNTVALTWLAEQGVAQYQVFLRNQSSRSLIFSGSGNACQYNVPDGTDSSVVFTFDLRSISSSGLGSDFTECTVSNIPPVTVAPGDVNPVSLQVAGWRPATTGDELDVIGPTNLAISASVNLPNVTLRGFLR